MINSNSGATVPTAGSPLTAAGGGTPKKRPRFGIGHVPSRSASIMSNASTLMKGMGKHHSHIHEEGSASLRTSRSNSIRSNSTTTTSVKQTESTSGTIRPHATAVTRTGLHVEVLENDPIYPHRPFVLLCWKAHMSSITAIQYLDRYNTIITSSRDRHCTIWDVNGNKCGCLDYNQGVNSFYNIVSNGQLKRPEAEPSPENWNGHANTTNNPKKTTLPARYTSTQSTQQNIRTAASSVVSSKTNQIPQERDKDTKPSKHPAEAHRPPETQEEKKEEKGSNSADDSTKPAETDDSAKPHHELEMENEPHPLVASTWRKKPSAPVALDPEELSAARLTTSTTTTPRKVHQTGSRHLQRSGGGNSKINPTAASPPSVSVAVTVGGTTTLERETSSSFTVHNVRGPQQRKLTPAGSPSGVPQQHSSLPPLNESLTPGSNLMNTVNRISGGNVMLADEMVPWKDKALQKKMAPVPVIPSPTITASGGGVKEKETTSKGVSSEDDSSGDDPESQAILQYLRHQNSMTGSGDDEEPTSPTMVHIKPKVHYNHDDDNFEDVIKHLTQNENIQELDVVKADRENRPRKPSLVGMSKEDVRNLFPKIGNLMSMVHAPMTKYRHLAQSAQLFHSSQNVLKKEQDFYDSDSDCSFDDDYRQFSEKIEKHYVPHTKVKARVPQFKKSVEQVAEMRATREEKRFKTTDVQLGNSVKDHVTQILLGNKKLTSDRRMVDSNVVTSKESRTNDIIVDKHQKFVQDMKLKAHYQNNDADGVTVEDFIKSVQSQEDHAFNNTVHYNLKFPNPTRGQNKKNQIRMQRQKQIIKGTPQVAVNHLQPGKRNGRGHTPPVEMGDIGLELLFGL